MAAWNHVHSFDKNNSCFSGQSWIFLFSADFWLKRFFRLFLHNSVCHFCFPMYVLHAPLVKTDMTHVPRNVIGTEHTASALFESFWLFVPLKGRILYSLVNFSILTFVACKQTPSEGAQNILQGKQAVKSEIKLLFLSRLLLLQPPHPRPHSANSH